MNISNLRNLIKESPAADKDTKIRTTMLQNLSTIISDFKDLRELIELYPEERTLNIQLFVFNNRERFFKNLDDAKELIDIFPALKRTTIRLMIFQDRGRFIKNLDDAKQLMALYTYPEDRWLIRSVILSDLKNFLKNANDYKLLCELYSDAKEDDRVRSFINKHPEVLREVSVHEQAPAPAREEQSTPTADLGMKAKVVPSKRTQPVSLSNINMQVLSGFIWCC